MTDVSDSGVINFLAGNEEENPSSSSDFPNFFHFSMVKVV